MQVVADTSVCNDLLLLGQLALLPTLYGRIIAPPVVLEVELLHPRSPILVRIWAQQSCIHPLRMFGTFAMVSLWKRTLLI